MVVKRHRSEVSANSQQQQQQNAQAIRRIVEEKQDTIISQPEGEEVTRDQGLRIGIFTCRLLRVPVLIRSLSESLSDPYPVLI